MTVVHWLVPICAFLVAAPMYYGGMAIRIEGGGGGRQTAGLLVSFGIYLAAAVFLEGLLEGIMAAFFAVTVSTVVALLLVPVISRVGFRVFGVKIVRPPTEEREAHAH